MIQKLFLRCLIFAATAEYNFLHREKARSGHALGKAVMRDAAAQKNLETCRAILHGWQHKLKALEPTDSTPVSAELRRTA